MSTEPPQSSQSSQSNQESVVSKIGNLLSNALEKTKEAVSSVMPSSNSGTPLPNGQQGGRRKRNKSRKNRKSRTTRKTRRY